MIRQDQPKVITNKRELHEYLRQHDPDMLKVFSDFAKHFGPADVIGYIAKAPSELSRLGETQ